MSKPKLSPAQKGVIEKMRDGLALTSRFMYNLGTRQWPCPIYTEAATFTDGTKVAHQTIGSLRKMGIVRGGHPEWELTDIGKNIEL